MASIYSDVARSVLSACLRTLSAPCPPSLLMASIKRSRHLSLCLPLGLNLPYRSKWSHCGQFGVRPCLTISLVRICRARGSACVATSGLSSGGNASRLASGSRRVRSDQGVARTDANAEGSHLSDSGLGYARPPSFHVYSRFKKLGKSNIQLTFEWS